MTVPEEWLKFLSRCKNMCNKPVIIAIVGPSGSGKTYLTQFLNDKLGIPFIVSLTTRQKRDNEIDGIDHVFVDEWEIQRQFDKRNILAYTRFGNHEYCALKSDIPKSGICTYVIDEIGLLELVKRHGRNYHIVSVYIKRSKENRIQAGIDSRRMKRDGCRRKLPMDYYDCIITNNGTIEDFEKQILNSINGCTERRT